MEDISLLHLVYIHGSITKAAESAGMSQSSLSKKLKAIESKLGVTLFERRTRKIAITPLSLEFLENTASITKTIEAAVSALRLADSPKYIQLDLAESLI